MNSNRMSEITVNCRQNGGRRRGRTLKGLLDGPEHVYGGLIANDNDDDDNDDYYYC
jgi:hypothetical protein